MKVERKSKTTTEWWARLVKYDFDGPNVIFIPWNVFNRLVEEGYATTPEIENARIGDSVGNYLIRGVGIGGISLNRHPSSPTKRLMLEKI